MKIARFAILFFWFIPLQALFGQGKGAVEGRLVNRTDPSIVARSVDLEVIGLGSGMSIIRTAVTDSAGKFRIDGLPENQELVIRANYKGANYHSPVNIGASGKAAADIEIYEPTTSWKDIPVEGVQIAFQTEGDRLRVLESYVFNNKTKPPRTHVNPEGVFRISKLAGILDPPQIRVTGSGSSRPLVQSAFESADSRSYYSLYPLKPGTTTFEVQEFLPYTSRSYAYTARFYHDVDSIRIGVIPHDLTVAGNGLTKIETNPDQNFAVYSSPPVKAGTEVVWTFSGGTPVSQTGPGEAGGEPAIQPMPNEVGRNALVIGPLLLLGFVLALWYSFNRRQNGPS